VKTTELRRSRDQAAELTSLIDAAFDEFDRSTDVDR
jgi:hypothetical protein